MAETGFKRRIRDLFRAEFVHEPDESVQVSDGYAENVHVKVVSHQFDGLDVRRQQKLISDLIYNHLPPDDWVRISLTEAKPPEPNGKGTARRRAKRT
jgi:hypothetical protein